MSEKDYTDEPEASIQAKAKDGLNTSVNDELEQENQDLRQLLRDVGESLFEIREELQKVNPNDHDDGKKTKYMKMAERMGMKANEAYRRIDNHLGDGDS